MIEQKSFGATKGDEIMTKKTNNETLESWQKFIRDLPETPFDRVRKGVSKEQLVKTGAKDEKDYYEHYASEKEFLAWYAMQQQESYPKPSATVDLIALRWNEKHQAVQVLLIQRKAHPFKDKWALPGGFIEERESINDAVIRETKEETGIDLPKNQLGHLPNVVRLPAVSSPYRDPRMWVITNPNIVLLNSEQSAAVTAGDDAEDAVWRDIETTPKGQLVRFTDLAFDHQMILQTAIDYLIDDFDHRRLPLLTNLLSDHESLRQLVKVYSSINHDFDNYSTSNFSRVYHKYLTPTDKSDLAHHQRGDRGRPAKIYKLDI